MTGNSAEELALAEAIEALHIQAQPRSKKRGHADISPYPEWFQAGRPRQKRGYPDPAETTDPVDRRQNIYPEILQELLIYAPDSHLDPAEIFHIYVRGDDPQFKHYLPWFLEQVARKRDLDYDAQPLFRKLTEANWHEWPEDERIKIRNFMRALWCAFLVKDTKHTTDDELDCYAHRNAGDLLGCYAEAIDDLQEFLDIWFGYCARCCTPAWEKLIKFIENSWALIPELSLESEDHILRRRCQVTSWLLNPNTIAAFERVYFQHAQEPCANSIAIVIDYLTAAIKSRNLETPER